MKKRVDHYIFTTADRNDARIEALKVGLKGSGLRVRLRGRGPKVKGAWGGYSGDGRFMRRRASLPLDESTRFDVYIIPIDSIRTFS